MNIAVIGGGINGMSCAYLIKQKFPFLNVHVYAENFSPNTTSNVAAGLWHPGKVENTPRERLNRLAKVSYDYAMEVLANDPDSASKGFAFQPGYFVSRKPITKTWAYMVHFPIFMSPEEIHKRFPHLDEDVKYGLHFTSFTLESTKFLPHLANEFKGMGGVLIQRKIKNLSELSENYDIVVNCAGLGAQELLKDEKMHPIRGQILLMEAPWLKEFFMDLDIRNGCTPYAIPNINHVVVGGTKQMGRADTLPTDSERERILEDITKQIPSLKNAKVLKEVVGIRPGREELRLEMEEIEVAKDRTRNESSERITVIHNYGHGANGITLSWGCAKEVVEMLTKCLKEKTMKSKL